MPSQGAPPASSTPSHHARASPAATPGARTGTATAHEAITAAASEIVRGWPVGAGLEGAGDVVSHLPPILPAPPSFFPPLSSLPTSLHPATTGVVPSDPLFDQYSREFAALLAPQRGDPHTERWRDDQVRGLVALREVQEQLTSVQRGGYAGLPPLQPPYPILPTAQLTPTPSSSTPLLAASFLSASSFPLPPPAGPASNPLQARHLAPAPPAQSMLESFIDTHYARAQANAAVASEMRRSNSLGGGGGGSGPGTPSASQAQHAPRRRKRASSSDLSSHFSSPLKPSDAGAALRAPAPPSQGERTPTLAASSSHAALGEPFTGAGSAFERVKLASASGGAPCTGGSAGTTGGASDPVEKLSDLLSEVFSADDAFVGDTSGAAVALSAQRSPARKPSGGERRFFRATRANEAGARLLHTDTLRRMQVLLRAVAARGKADELLEEVEEGGVARWLRVLERSWEGVGDAGGWEGWEREAALPREGGAEGVEGKGKGKAKGAKGRKSASPAKKGKRKGKAPRRSAAAAGEEDEDDDDLDMLASSSPARGVRRSSRSASPRRDRSATVDAHGEDDDAAAEEDDSQRTATSASYWDADASRLATTEAALRDLSDALLALRVALEILTLPGVSLPKHLFSSEYLLGVVSTLRRALDACLLPLLEAPPSSALAELASTRARDATAAVTDALTQGTHALAALVRNEDLGDELVIALAYFALEPFFHDAPLPPARAAAAKDASPATNAIKSLRLASLAVVQAVYARYADQRAWIVEEVLGNLGKAESAAGTAAAKKARRGIRLRTGATIQTVSALLLHLVQTCPADLHAQVRRKLAQQAKAEGDGVVGGEDVEMEDELGLGARLLENGRSQEEEDGADVFASVQRLLGGALDMSSKAARTIVGFLLQRAAKAGKTTGAAADTEYRAVLDKLIADLLATLHLPEWPGAEVLLTVLCRSMMATLADPKSTHESNALKGIALEYVGAIAARVRLDVGKATSGLRSLREVVADADADALEKTVVAHKAVLEHLVKTEQTTGHDGAAAFARAQFAQDVLQALQLSTERLEDASQDGAQAVHDRLVALVKEVWEDDQVEDVFGPSPEDSQPRIDTLSLELWRSSTLASLYQPILTRIVDASESAQVAQRTKALRATSLVVAQDPDLFHQDNIRRSIENRTLDSSPQVRDAAIELVGKYVVSRPDLAVQYLPRLGERISDTGLAVRRRVIKLLRVLYGVVREEEHKVDISRKLVYRVLDEDDGIKELAVETIEEIWFGPPPKGAAQEADASLAQLASIITQTAGVFKDRPPPVDEALRLIMAKHAEKGTQPPLDRLRVIMESLIDGLVEDERDMDLVAVIKTVYLLSSVDASLLSTAKATMLLPFLKSAATPEEQVISDYLLRIFRAAVVAMPKTASKFGRDLQGALVPMLNKPSQNLTTLQEVVACFCAVVHGQTQDFATMFRVFAVSLRRLQQEGQKLLNAETAKDVNLRPLPVLCYMASLLCEHGDFDRLRDEQPAMKATVDQLSPNSIAELAFGVLVRLYNLSIPAQIKSAVLTSLGFLYRAHPTLMLHQASTAIIDAIFESAAPQMHLQILRIVQDFLASQERAVAGAAGAPADKKRKKAENGVKMEELVGNVEGFADSGVASAISQRYLKRIIDTSLSPSPVLQRLGLDLLNTVARSGFSHPITLAPTLVALTVSADPALASKAYATLAVLHQKHASLLVTRFLEPARAAHSFALKALGEGEMLRGYRGDPPESLLGRWYSLLHKEKRQVQLDYLKTLARSLELDVGAPCSANDVSFFRFLAEALSTFDYKRAEEPLIVVALLNTALAVAGVQVLHALEQDLAGGGGLMAAAGASPKKVANGAVPSAAAAADAPDADEEDRPPPPDLARQSLVLGLALLLRDHLKRLYSLTDAKLGKYVVGKKSAMGDKAVSRNADAPAALGADGYARMPLVLREAEMEGEEERREQRATFMRLIAEDGTIAALDELADDDDA
ncbi:Sister chromatid cohesion protein 2 [Rhodotorula kratochvilovae]